MAKQTQLELIRDLAQSREQELAAEVGELRRLQIDAQSALNRLNGYLAEYTVTGTADHPHGGRDITQMENERRFVGRLQQAVEQQHLHVQQFAQKTHLKVQAWHRERLNLEALDKVVDQRRLTAKRIHARLEQAQADAISGRSLAFKNATTNTILKSSLDA